MKRSIIPLFLFCIASALFAQNNPFFEGAGGAGIRVAVLQPSGSGLSAQEQWLLKLVQSTLTGDFNKFSAMTVIDRQNLDKILGEQNESLSGNYSDADFISIGKLTNARYILAGTITKTSGGFMLELAVSDAQTGVRTASFPPRNCSLDELQSTSVVRQASEELLKQMGVTLTAIGKQSLMESISAVPQAVSGAEANASTSSTVTTANGQRLSFIEYLSQTADALYSVGDVRDALYYYRSLASYYPGYYKGWLGIVRCFSSNFTNFDFIDSEVYMERASITAAANAEKQEVQKVRAAFDAQWPRIATLREQRAIEDARRRQDNFQRMAYKIENNTLVEFRGSGWEEAIIPPEVTVIGDAAFRQNGKIKKVALHDKVTSIGRNAFANCTNLVEIAIPSSVTSIGSGAFQGCSSLAEITIPARVSVVPDNVFANCKNLRSVAISPGVQRIEKSFQNCESLTSIIIPRSVQSIGDFAFSQCKNLKTVTLLNEKITVGRRAFMGTSLTNKEEMISRFGATVFN